MHPKSKACYYNFGNRELTQSSYQLAEGAHEWVKPGGNETYVVAGIADSGDEIYICRGQFNGLMTPGRYDGKSTCLVPYGLTINVLSNYEVLTSPKVCPKLIIESKIEVVNC